MNLFSHDGCCGGHASDEDAKPVDSTAEDSCHSDQDAGESEQAAESAKAGEQDEQSKSGGCCCSSQE